MTGTKVIGRETPKPSVADSSFSPSVLLADADTMPEKMVIASAENISFMRDFRGELEKVVKDGDADDCRKTCGNCQFRFPRLMLWGDRRSKYGP